MGLRRTKRKFLRQDAIYWAPTGATDAFGEMILHPPVPIKCRWEDKTELVRIRTGEELTTRAQVFTDRVVEEEGVLWLGSFATAQIENHPVGHPAAGTPNPFVNKKAWKIMQFGSQPDFKARDSLDWAWL